jgi:hypothetical protein
MSEYGDKFFRRLQKILAGVESGTVPGKRCTRCQKDLSEYVVFDPDFSWSKLCDQCNAEVRKEEFLARRTAAKPPVYDIDLILSTPGKKPWEILKDLDSKIDPFCAEALLLAPELVVRDFQQFSSLLGDRFGYILALCEGVRQFSQGLRAMCAIGATHMVEYMTKCQAYAASRGVTFPDPLPDPWLDHVPISPDLEEELNSMDDELGGQARLNAGELDRMAFEYLRQHVDVLRQRKP